MTKYDIIFEALQERVNSGELTIEQAEIVNNAAYEKYVMEDGHSKKLKARHNAKKKHIEQRFYDNMGYKHEYNGSSGANYGTVQRGDGPKVNMFIDKKGTDACYDSYTNSIHIGRKLTRLKGSDVIGSHEYSHAIDQNNIDKIYDNPKLIKSIATKYGYTKPVISTSDIDDDKIRKQVRKDLYKIHEINKKSILKDQPILYKDAKKKYKQINLHDKRPDEIRADLYAITSTKGENNSNRLRKALNENIRRIHQNKGIDNVKYASKMLKQKNDGPQYKQFLRKKVASGVDKIISSVNKANSNMTKKRQDVTDYIIKNQQK